MIGIALVVARISFVTALLSPPIIIMTKSPTSVAHPHSFQILSLTTAELNISENNSDMHSIHHPRTLIFELSSVVGQLSALFLQTMPLDPPVTGAEGKLNNCSSENGQAEQSSFSCRGNQVGSDVATCMSRVLLVLVELSHSLSVNLGHSIQKKMMLNKKKYPEELCKGKSGKYTEYSDKTGITKDGGQSTLHVDECSVSHETLESFLGTIDNLTLEIRGFATARQCESLCVVSFAP